MIEPIALTPEILEQCGFELDRESIGTIIIRFSTHAITFLVDKDGNISDRSNIYYLHQLQTIYSALTGKELQIKATVKV